MNTTSMGRSTRATKAKANTASAAEVAAVTAPSSPSSSSVTSQKKRPRDDLLDTTAVHNDDMKQAGSAPVTKKPKQDAKTTASVSPTQEPTNGAAASTLR